MKVKTKQCSFQHDELEKAGIRHCRRNDGDHFAAPGAVIPAGIVVLGKHGAVTALRRVKGFAFGRLAEYAANIEIESNGHRIKAMGRIENGNLIGNFYAAEDGGFYTGNRELAGRSEIGCRGYAKVKRVLPK